MTYHWFDDTKTELVAEQAVAEGGGGGGGPAALSSARFADVSIAEPQVITAGTTDAVDISYEGATIVDADEYWGASGVGQPLAVTASDITVGYPDSAANALWTVWCQLEIQSTGATADDLAAAIRCELRGNNASDVRTIYLSTEDHATTVTMLMVDQVFLGDTGSHMRVGLVLNEPLSVDLTITTCELIIQEISGSVGPAGPAGGGGGGEGGGGTLPVTLDGNSIEVINGGLNIVGASGQGVAITDADAVETSGSGIYFQGAPGSQNVRVYLGDDGQFATAFNPDGSTALPGALTVAGDVTANGVVLGAGGGGGSFPDFTGDGSPEGVQDGTTGQSYVDTTNGALYFLAGADGNTGWVIGSVAPTGDLAVLPGTIFDPDSNTLRVLGPPGSGRILITDTVAWDGTGNGIYWNGHSNDGGQTASVCLGDAGQFTTHFNADGTTTFPGQISTTDADGRSVAIYADGAEAEIDLTSPNGAGVTIAAGDDDRHGAYLYVSASPTQTDPLIQLFGADSANETRFNADGSTVLPGPLSIAGGPATGPMLPIADPTGVTIETADNPVTGEGTIDVLTFPADTPVLAVKLEGDAFARTLILADPTGSGGIFLGDGSNDMWASGNNGYITGGPASLELGANTPDYEGGVRINLSEAIRLNGPVQIRLDGSDLTFDRASIGPVLVDQSDGHTYRLICTAGVLSTELVT
jgi:hypothetical protein